MLTKFTRSLFLLAVVSVPALSGAAIQHNVPDGFSALTDEELSGVTGQALFVSDRIGASGAGTGATPTDFVFHRMGLDVNLELNANIDKLQLGCGGFNDTINPNVCDIDMDFVRFMGRNGSQPGAPVTSDFVLTRPYVEIAVVNEGTPSQREVVGIKIGAQSADGFMSVGRDYLTAEGNPSNLTNQENGGTCNDTEGAGALACHSGLNSLSGSITAELSGALDVSITLAGTSNACFGRTNVGNGQCSNNPVLYQDIIGSRLTRLQAPNLKLELDGGLADLIADSAYAQVDLNTRFIHGFALENTDDFFLSFQRQKVAYPTFDGSSNSNPANAGWWLNVPLVRIVDLEAPSQSLGLFEGLSALSPPGITFRDLELGQRAASNCYGSQMFC